MMYTDPSGYYYYGGGYFGGASSGWNSYSNPANDIAYFFEGMRISAGEITHFLNNPYININMEIMPGGSGGLLVDFASALANFNKEREFFRFQTMQKLINEEGAYEIVLAYDNIESFRLNYFTPSDWSSSGAEIDVAIFDYPYNLAYYSPIISNQSAGSYDDPPNNQGGNIIDATTKEFNNYIEQTRILFTSMGKFYDKNFTFPTSHIMKLAYFAEMNLHDINMNPKINLKSTFSKSHFYYKQLMKPQDFGNYNYGVAAKALGLSPIEAVGGGGFAAFYLDGTKTWWNLPGFIDEFRDTQMILRGYFHFK